MLKHAFSSLFTLAILTSPYSALAATKSFIIDGGLMRAIGPGSAFIGNGVSMAHDTDGGFGINLIIPKGFKKNAPLTLQTRLSIDAANCTVKFLPVLVIRNRPGSEQTGGGFGGNGVFEATVPSDENQVFTMTFKLAASTGETVAGQKAGDHIYIEYARSAESDDDNCAAALRATSVKVIYPVD